LWRGFRTAVATAFLKATFRPLALVGLMALNLIGEAGGTATRWRALLPHLRLGLRLRWPARPSRVGAAMAAAMLATTMLATTLAGVAIAMTVAMLLPRLGESGCGGQGQNGNGYQQTAHLILRENTARLITGLYRFGFPLAPLWSAHA